MPFFTSDSVSLFYTTHPPSYPPPTSPPLLLLHGWACSSSDFTHQIPSLTSFNTHIITLDHRGHGKSCIPSSSNYSMRKLANDVLALLQHLKISTVVIVAHSMSTIIASILAVENPEVVSGLVLLHPIYCGTPPALAALWEEIS
ncbi:alpha/beta-hydrolase [Byssothecium circinans]|uniref:Alpha/beta-hydrolase n=1 Tax=Byssothecium circinans TaxID=147558 RepID=A0A6A5TZI5_9PLEO|nr:alpha/beta-hydrolase [Byssothecium circinans]